MVIVKTFILSVFTPAHPILYFLALNNFKYYVIVFVMAFQHTTLYQNKYLTVIIILT